MQHTNGTGYCSISLRPENGGFWYALRGPIGSEFWFSYIAVGTGGHQLAGEVQGTLGDADDWAFCSTNFAVMHVGATEIEFVSSHEFVAPHNEGSGNGRPRSGSSPQPMSAVGNGFFVPASTMAIPEGEVFSGTQYPYYP